ncbi:hypothetical protein [Klebsiella pneumoniae]|uniref:hypothetical protein n=2 Tax=Klebsiella pneumoniae TaxID=573 RepID=UPI00209C67AD|nr:hypothetical protein [Klebsiella pneumoniae]MDS7711960.1 hypothetical protein [Klebsiella pneumoniae]MDS7739483.1 hypothetical protein [Klebsiella pneumoniae]WJG07043.1 hypothetical protein QSG82_09700 [Klebsiella pneumoniae]
MKTQPATGETYPKSDLFNKASQGEKNTWWTKVGVAFPHHGKSGLNIVLTPGIAVSGKLVLLEPREENNPPQNTGPIETVS